MSPTEQPHDQRGSGCCVWADGQLSSPHEPLGGCSGTLPTLAATGIELDGEALWWDPCGFFADGWVCPTGGSPGVPLLAKAPGTGLRAFPACVTAVHHSFRRLLCSPPAAHSRLPQPPWPAASPGYSLQASGLPPLSLGPFCCSSITCEAPPL